MVFLNTLIHITDPIQNEKFTDKYFQEIDLDLSKAIIIFTYNKTYAFVNILLTIVVTLYLILNNLFKKPSLLLIPLLLWLCFASILNFYNI